MNTSTRGQSEVVGTLLMALLVILLIGLITPMVLGSLDTQDERLLNVDATATESTLSVTHTGGDSIDASEISALLTIDGTTHTISGQGAGAPDPFGPGDIWSIHEQIPDYNPTYGERISVKILAGNDDQVVHSETLTVGTGGAPISPTPTEPPTATVTPTPEPDPIFEVSITSTNSPVVRGESLEVTANVHNTGNTEGTQLITLDVDGIREQVELTLAAGEDADVILTWNTGPGDHAGSPYFAIVSSDSDSDTTEVEVTNRQGGPSN